MPVLACMREFIFQVWRMGLQLPQMSEKSTFALQISHACCVHGSGYTALTSSGLPLYVSAVYSRAVSRCFKVAVSRCFSFNVERSPAVCECCI